MRHSLRALPLVLLALCLLLPSVRAEPDRPFRLEARVPGSTLGVVTLEDVGRWEERFQQTAIAGFFKDPEVAAFCAPMKAALENWMGAEDGPLAEVPPIVWDALKQLSGLRGQLALALVDIDLEQGMPQLVASLDFGSHLADFLTFVGRIKAEMDPEGEMLATFEKDGRTWWRVTADGAPPMTATTVGTSFVLGTDEALVASVLAGEAPASLATSGDFATVRERVGGKDLGVLAYMNAPAVWAKFKDQLDAEIVKLVDALGLEGVRALAYGMSFKGDGFQDSFVIHAPGSSHGLFTVAPQRALRPVALKRYAPATAFLFEEGALEDPAQILPALRAMIGRVEPEALQQMGDVLTDMSATLGVDIEKELIAGLAGGYSFYAGMPETGGLYPEMALLLQVKDPAAYEQTFSRFTNGLAGMLTEQGELLCSASRVLEYRGRRLHLFEMQAAQGDDVVPFTPTWMMSEDWLVLTLVPYTMKEIVARRAEQGGATSDGGLAAQEDFAALLAAMPAGTTHMSYVDLQSVMNLVYDTGVPLLQTAVKPNLLGDKLPFALDWAQLPPARTVRKHFRSLGVYVTCTRDGMSINLHAPVPMLGVVAMAAAVAVPFMMMSRQSMQWEDEAWMEAVPKEMPGRDGMSPRDELARVQAQDVARYVRAFLLNHKRLPESLEEIVDSGLARQIQLDPWQTPFVLEPQEGGRNRFQIVSAGPDQEFGTEDDIRVDG